MEAPERAIVRPGCLDFRGLPRLLYAVDEHIDRSQKVVDNVYVTNCVARLPHSSQLRILSGV